MKIVRSMRGIGCQGDGKTIQRNRETFATGFNVSLLLCPAAEKGFGVEMVRERIQMVDFSG